jgi:aspartyl-tRNA(Asn)/glutamyl-tRNA(Gln) amidotransferase subunit B
VEVTLKRGDGAVSATHAGREAAKWILNAGAKRANESGVGIQELGISPGHIAQIIELRDRNQIGSTAADELFGMLCEPKHRAADAFELARQRGLIQVRDDTQLDTWVDEAIKAQPQAASDFAAGKDAAAGRLVGHIMKISQGKADATAIQAKLREKLRR